MRNPRLSVYSGARTSMSDFRRDSSFHSRSALNNHRLSCDFRQGSSLVMSQNQQHARQNHNGHGQYLSPDYDRISPDYGGCNGNGNSRYLGVGSNYCGGSPSLTNGGGSIGSTFVDSNGRIQLDTSTMISEIENENNGIDLVENGGSGCNNGSASFDSNKSQTTTAVAVITANCRPLTNGNHHGKTMTVVATDTTFRL